MQVAVIGLGYVGLPLAMEFAKSGLEVIGIDISQEKVDLLNRGESYVMDLPSSVIHDLVISGKFRATTQFSALENADAVCICVPTPLTKTMDPDISHIIDAVNEIQKYLHKGMLVVLESTTYPGTTDEVLLPKLASTGLTVGMDYFLAFSPERVDPGNRLFATRNTPKVIGGMTPQCTEKAVALYRHAVDTVVPVSSPRTAEMVKLLENTFRAINIGLANELAIMCDHLGVNVWEVVDAAKTKPFGFMPFYPGPGLGGHCIPIDPLYLSWKLRSFNYTARFIELATAINMSMPSHIVSKITDALNEDRKSLKGSNILILGVTYKRDVRDVRESPALDIIECLTERGAEVRYFDPYVPEVEILGQTLRSFDPVAEQDTFDCIAIISDHSAFDYPSIMRRTSLVFDSRNALRDVSAPKGCRVVRL